MSLPMSEEFKNICDNACISAEDAFKHVVNNSNISERAKKALIDDFCALVDYIIETQRLGVTGRG